MRNTLGLGSRLTIRQIVLKFLFLIRYFYDKLGEVVRAALGNTLIKRIPSILTFKILFSGKIFLKARSLQAIIQWISFHSVILTEKILKKRK